MRHLVTVRFERSDPPTGVTRRETEVLALVIRPREQANAAAVKDGRTVTPSVAGATAVTMVNNKSGATLATPSALGPDGASSR
jgi:hypothetical protein